MTKATRELYLADEHQTDALAATFAEALKVGDVVLLKGDVGTGKTSFCRSFIRNRLGQMEDVPSPTFTIVQTYEDPEGDIWHCDLYRLSSMDEVIELGLEEAFVSAICLIEWPNRLGEIAPKDAVELDLSVQGEGRRITITAPQNILAKIAFQSD